MQSRFLARCIRVGRRRARGLEPLNECGCELQLDTDSCSDQAAAYWILFRHPKSEQAAGPPIMFDM